MAVGSSGMIHALDTPCIVDGSGVRRMRLLGNVHNVPDNCFAEHSGQTNHSMVLVHRCGNLDVPSQGRLPPRRFDRDDADGRLACRLRAHSDWPRPVTMCRRCRRCRHSADRQFGLVSSRRFLRSPGHRCGRDWHRPNESHPTVPDQTIHRTRAKTIHNFCAE